MKRIITILLSLAALMAFPAIAADTAKGINQNGVQETVGTKHIFAVKLAGGVLSYRSQIGGGTVYALSDASGANQTKVLNSFGTGNATVTVDGWYYDLGKIKVICSGGSTSIIAIAGVNNADYLADNCAFANAANSQ